MSALLRRGAAISGLLAIAFVGLLLGAGAASAEPEAPDSCFEPNRYGELPTCTWDGTRWSRSFEGDGMSGDGPGDGFGALVVLGILGSVGFTVWKVSTARRMARDSGMSTRDATAMTLLSDDGFEATYLASNLRGRSDPAPAQPAAPAQAPAPPATLAERLRQLAELRDQGLITSAEHDARRARILDAL